MKNVTLQALFLAVIVQAYYIQMKGFNLQVKTVFVNVFPNHFNNHLTVALNGRQVLNPFLFIKNFLEEGLYKASFFNSGFQRNHPPFQGATANLLYLNADGRLNYLGNTKEIKRLAAAT